MIAGQGGRDAAPIRFVQVGSASAPNVTLPSAALCSSAIALMGRGIGAIPLDRFVSAIAELLHATAPGGFEIRAKPVPLSEVEQAWPHDDSPAHRVHRKLTNLLSFYAVASIGSIFSAPLRPSRKLRRPLSCTRARRAGGASRSESLRCH